MVRDDGRGTKAGMAVRVFRGIKLRNSGKAGGRKEEGRGRRKEEGGRRKEEGGRRKEEGKLT
jgi:hypothetical protein